MVKTKLLHDNSLKFKTYLINTTVVVTHNIVIPTLVRDLARILHEIGGDKTPVVVYNTSVTKH